MEYVPSAGLECLKIFEILVFWESKIPSENA
jgi:hypothetical protein